MNALQDFLKCDSRFKWWLVLGTAGVGKSRLALEFCVRNQPEWDTGWLMEVRQFKEWRAWQPQAPTLVIVDGVAAQEEPVRRMIVSLFRRIDTLEYPVRVLLLERE